MVRFNGVTILIEGKKVPFTLSLFKTKKNKITKDEYKNYLYKRAINFGLFYIGFCGKSEFDKYSIDISSKLGNLRFVRLYKTKEEHKKWLNYITATV